MSQFQSLGLSPSLLPTLTALGYESPTPIQLESIPILLKGGDLLAQAQTGTGKTAAFALPILSTISLSVTEPQALILTPTRELAIQVAESFQHYAKGLSDFHVLPIYGGQDMGWQLKRLKRGVHVVVGTPGRIMDHLRRGSLSLKKIKTLVLDEADEMLKMGFIESVEWILEQIKQPHQTALFSATIPVSIRKIADQYLKNATHIKIKAKAMTVAAISQFYMMVYAENKLEALLRFLELETMDGVIIFTRTKNASSELAEKLAARGFSASAINGDMSQDQREKSIKRMKQRHLDIIVATDVAARGLDVERLTHVINYDIPYDVDAYVHRIGRTGRAGREGKALLLISPREQRMLKEIERTTRQTIVRISPPTHTEINEKRLITFTNKVIDTLEKKDLSSSKELAQALCARAACREIDLAASLLQLFQTDLKLKTDTTDIEFLPPKKARSDDRNPKRSQRPRGRFQFKGKPRKR